MKKGKILITGGVHGDEPTGIEVAAYFSREKGPIRGILCNPKAVSAEKRFLETDLNRSFDVSEPVSLEEHLAKCLRGITKKYDLVLDIHNTKAMNTLCAITTCKPNATHLYLAKHFGFKKIVIMPPSGSLIATVPKRAISLEIPANLNFRFSPQKLVQKIKRLDIKGRENRHDRFSFYKFVNKVLTSSLERLKLEKASFSNFRRLTQHQKEILGLKPKNTYYPIFLKEREEEVAFSLVKRINVQ